jgi:hypothetical protein
VLLEDVSRDGKVVITRYDRSMHVDASLKDADARGISWLDFQWARDITPDSQRILLTYSGQGSSPNYDVYVHSVGESEGTRIGEGQPQQFSPMENGRARAGITVAEPLCRNAKITATTRASVMSMVH